MKDTFNLLADGMVKLMRALASVERSTVSHWAEAQGYERYLGSSIKGESAIDWSDRKARAGLLATIVADADRLLEVARQAQGALPEGSPERQGIVAAAELLGQLLLQDVERADDGIGLKDGVSKDRMMSVHDPEMRHGHSSSRRRFDGHKAAIVVDTDTQLITAVEVLPGNAPDNLGPWNWWNGVRPTPVCRWRSRWATPPTATAIPGRPSPTQGAPCLPGCRGVPTRPTFPRKTSLSTWSRGPAPARLGTLPGSQALWDAGRPHGSDSPAESLPVRCGGVWSVFAAAPVAGSIIGIAANGATAPAGGFVAAGPRPAAERGPCRVPSTPGGGGAPAVPAGAAGDSASPVLRAGQTRFELYLAATVANLTLVAGNAGIAGETGAAPSVGNELATGIANSASMTEAKWAGQLQTLILLASYSLPKFLYPTRGFRPSF